MQSRIILILIAVMFLAHYGNAQRRQKFIDSMPARTAETDAEVLRLMRNEKLEFIQPPNEKIELIH